MSLLLSLTGSAPSAVDFSSATTDGADVLAGQIAVIVAVSSATTDGADVLAGVVSPLVATSSATTDGADILTAAIAPLVAISSATTDGADIFAGAIAPLIAVSSSSADGADVLSAQIFNAAVVVGHHGGDDAPKKHESKRLKKIKLRKDIEEAWAKVTGETSTIEIKEEALELVPADIQRPIEWIAKDFYRVQKLLSLWERQALEQDDEDVLMLLM